MEPHDISNSPPTAATDRDQLVALITGASRGLGAAIATHLCDLGWRVVVTARGQDDLDAVVAGAAGRSTGHMIPVASDVTDPTHRAALVDTVGPRLDLLVNNASSLGPSPLPALADVALDDVRRVVETNIVAPLALIQLLLDPLEASDGAVMNISSDAAVGAWPGWGVYGPSKAALDHVTRILAVEHPRLSVYAVDPGDMRTDMHQAAFPDEDISDRPLPGTVVPALMALLSARPDSGRYVAAKIGGRSASLVGVTTQGASA